MADVGEGRGREAVAQVVVRMAEVMVVLKGGDGCTSIYDGDSVYCGGSGESSNYDGDGESALVASSW